MKTIDIQTICSSIDFDFKDRFFWIFDWPLWKVVSAAENVCFISTSLLEMTDIKSYLQNEGHCKGKLTSQIHFPGQ